MRLLLGLLPTTALANGCYWTKIVEEDGTRTVHDRNSLTDSQFASFEGTVQTFPSNDVHCAKFLGFLLEGVHTVLRNARDHAL